MSNYLFDIKHVFTAHKYSSAACLRAKMAQQHAARRRKR
jgi:hypothetical protein